MSARTIVGVAVAVFTVGAIAGGGISTVLAQRGTPSECGAAVLWETSRVCVAS